MATAVARKSNKSNHVPTPAAPKALLAICQPLDDRVVVKADPRVTMTPGGIALPAAARGELPQTGTVISVGPGRPLSAGGYAPMPVKPGQRVIFSRFAGQSIESAATREEDYLLLRVDDVLAILPED